jgi:hypothetical protein
VRGKEFHMDGALDRDSPRAEDPSGDSNENLPLETTACLGPDNSSWSWDSVKEKLSG